MTTPNIPLIDISSWRGGGTSQRETLAAVLDQAMKDSGFFLVSGHGISGELMTAIRSSAGKFFALSPTVKTRYATTVGGRGWLAKGREANAYYGEVPDATRADLKESLTFGRSHRTGDAALDGQWFTPNVWPAEVPELKELCEEFAGAVRNLYRELLKILATALKLPSDYFVERSGSSPHTLNINRYPSVEHVGPALEGQFRVAPHTDWGILTILDRQQGYGGLQVQTPEGEWVDAPYVPGALTVNIADLLARWTGDRWRSTRHRVLPPPANEPQEELISLIMFMECDMDLTISPLPHPTGGGTHYPPVKAGTYFLERSAAATV